MARKIKEREIYILSVRKLLTWKANGAYQTRKLAEADKDLALQVGMYSKRNMKIEQVTLNG